MPARVRQIQKERGKEAKVAKENEGDQTLRLLPFSLSLSLLFLSPLSLLDAGETGETRLIYVTIRHSILLYFSAYVLPVLTARRTRSESPPRWLRNPLRFVIVTQFRGVRGCASGMKYGMLD